MPSFFLLMEQNTTDSEGLFSRLNFESADAKRDGCIIFASSPRMKKAILFSTLAVGYWQSTGSQVRMRLVLVARSGFAALSDTVSLKLAASRCDSAFLQRFKALSPYMGPSPLARSKVFLPKKSAVRKSAR